MNHPKVATLDDQRAACGGQGELLHRRYMVMQNLHRRGEVQEQQRDRVDDVQSYLHRLNYVERKKKLFLEYTAKDP